MDWPRVITSLRIFRFSRVKIDRFGTGLKGALNIYSGV
jgi:hypothetical protein